MISKKTKRALKKIVFMDEQVSSAFRQFQKDNPEFDAGERPFAAASYITRLNWNQYRRNNLNEVRRPAGTRKYENHALSLPGSAWRRSIDRCSPDDLVAVLKPYDVVSFDIFDTVLYRAVDDPEDVFRLMGSEMGFTDFRRVRKAAESRARRKKKEHHRTREVLLSEIYDLLEREYGIDRSWEQREIEIEKAVLLPNTYMKYVYDELVKNGNTIVFTSDMYLPKSVLEECLARNGYSVYDDLFLSNEYGVCKGDGKLQLVLLEKYSDKSIVHVGDNEASDFEKTRRCGIDAIFNHDQRLLLSKQGAEKGDISGSVYRALINNKMNCGDWNKGLCFSHGYRVGGILLAGFCEYLNSLVDQHGYDKILFCARDCEIIWRAYNQFFKKCDNDYIAISRYAILQATADRYLYDFLGRSVLRHAKAHANDMTIEMILRETGFDYLVERLEAHDIEKYLFPSSLKNNKLEDFFYSERDTILAHNRESVEAAKKYFDAVVGTSNNILIVDVGWSGTCISALDYFLHSQVRPDGICVSGALLATSRNDVLTGAVSSGSIHSFLYSPQSNVDQARFFMPGGKRSIRETDLIHMPLEYLFTSTDGSLASYVLDGQGQASLLKTHRRPKNIEEIEQMQEGMLTFCEDYYDYRSKVISSTARWSISPYLASAPLREAIKDKVYLYNVYKNFVYDAVSPLFDDGSNDGVFGDLFLDEIEKKDTDNDNASFSASSKGHVLFVSPEMTYTGTPKSLLRICRVAKQEGYSVEVWTAKPGPFTAEFNAAGIEVLHVGVGDLQSDRIQKRILEFDAAICNTIVTDAYVRAIGERIPVAWYIREATNIPDFCAGHKKRLETLKACKGLVCVSDYAARAISEFTSMPIRVIRNAVGDYAGTVGPHEFAKDGIVRFVQMGTMEYRKGYDLCVAAYKNLPEEYKSRVEMYFAGGFIGSAASYCSHLFKQISGENNIYYLGTVKGESKKNELLNSMDVVMVASRDESCSLVALEGAMLSKPLLVTENVGAKYMVSTENGIVVPSGDVEALSRAIIAFVDNRSNLEAMGKKSRGMYEEYACMTSHARDIVALIEDTKSAKVQRGIISAKRKSAHIHKPKMEYVLSLTSHPGRINGLEEVIVSLLNQSVKPSHLILWLSEEQFPNREDDLPSYLVRLKDRGLEICWSKGDLRPHKKYFYTVQRYPDQPLIIVDDDTIYNPRMAETLLESYKDHPHAISCMRGNLILFTPDGEFRSYDNWVYDYRVKRGEPTYQLLPTGVGGVLYPPHSIPQEALNVDAIQEVAIDADDLWLKFFATANGYPAVLARETLEYVTVEGSQDVGLWNSNVFEGKNDLVLESIRNYMDACYGCGNDAVDRMRCIGHYGEWIGGDAVEYTSLLPR